ncbi:transporter substrate-binding domain-containing protein [Clostridium felsineum]|uniref:transporter substrate-binding domain-containing protein n=1 Tax=Clostridium felsineum TaxID=36839 RepID=UPI00098C4B75|nr:transporter substrate-binding domain-containing protein [Clostridium felsineum]URZ18402.1 L-cystine-binding protein TcyJ [Clostridium felsineum DSM 794]
MKKLKVLRVLVLGIVVGMVATGCSAKNNSSASASNPKKVVIAIGNAYKPYCYLDSKGKLVGYEVDVLNAINKKLPQYKFEYDQYDFKDVLISVESGKADVGAHQIEKNQDREKLFLYSKVPTDIYNLRLVVKNGRTDINSLADLKGKTVETVSGSNSAYVLDSYNKAHNNLFKIVYSSEDSATLVNNVSNGKYDAFLDIKRSVADYNKQFGNKLQIVGPIVASSSAYHVFNKKNTQLEADFEKALKEIKTDGTLSKLSIKDLGADYTKND